MMRGACVAICLVLAIGPNLSMADGDWYVAAGFGLSGGDDVQQDGWNADAFCYPDSACFDQVPVPRLPGYAWQYDNSLDRDGAFELSLGRAFGDARLELTFAEQSNDIEQQFKSIAYLDGTPVLPRAGAPVGSTSNGSIEHQRVRTLSLDAFYDIPVTWGALSPWVGAGIGLAMVEIGSVRFAIDYHDASGAAGIYDPPLTFYRSVQDEDLQDDAFVWHLHAGVDYALTEQTSLGLKFTWIAAQDIEDTGGYETHPMQQIDPAFANTNTFNGARNWRIMLTIRRGFGS